MESLESLNGDLECLNLKQVVRCEGSIRGISKELVLA